MKPITTYCKQQVEGWNPLPAMNSMFPEQLNFINDKEGIQLMTSIKDYGVLQVIHVSIGQVRTLRPDLTEEQLAENIRERTPHIINDFFGHRGFAMQPDDPRRPTVKHYFSILEVGE